MKKILITITLFIFFITPLSVSAGIKNTTTCENATIDAEGKRIRVCYIDITVTDTTRLYKIEGKLNFNNSSLKSIESLDSRLTMTNNDSNNIVFKSKNAIKNEKIRLAKVIIYIALDGKECNATWQPTEYGINYNCDIIDGNYYDSKGNLTNYNTYDKECNHYCEIVDNKYYGKNGSIVDQKTYDKECNKHVCEIIDNEYFGKNGIIVDQKTYDKECNKHVCEIIDNEYFGKNGIIVDEKTYDKECNKHICEIIDNSYYDNNGNIVSEKDYNKSCGKYSCVIVDNEYFNSQGKIVSEKDYNKDCGKFSCVIIDDEYYDETGKLVDKSTWEEMCTIPENPTTGSGSIIASAILGLISLAFIILKTKKSTKFYKI